MYNAAVYLTINGNFLAYLWAHKHYTYQNKPDNHEGHESQYLLYNTRITAFSKYIMLHLFSETTTVTTKEATTKSSEVMTTTADVTTTTPKLRRQLLN